MSDLSKQRHSRVLYATLQIIANAADRGERCPTSQEMVLQLFELGFRRKCSGTTHDLIKLGFIRVEVYGRNYRVVEIIDGQHKGKRTKEYPNVGVPYKILDGREKK